MKEHLRGQPATIAAYTRLRISARCRGCIVAHLNDAAMRALAMAEVKKSLCATGMTAAPSSPEEYGRFVDSEIAKWTKVTRAAKIEVQ